METTTALSEFDVSRDYQPRSTTSSPTTARHRFPCAVQVAALHFCTSKLFPYHLFKAQKLDSPACQCGHLIGGKYHLLLAFPRYLRPWGSLEEALRDEEAPMRWILDTGPGLKAETTVREEEAARDGLNDELDSGYQRWWKKQMKTGLTFRRKRVIIKLHH